ncbi:MAG TPA: hypothetical protein VHM19_12175 [Polyangiales bacterium]|nr:hypothetical protein [Polyangiales bacterium]
MKELVLRALVVALCCFCPALASAQLGSHVQTRAMQVTWGADGTPALGFSAKDFADAAVQKKLQSGLPQTIAVRVFAFADRRPEPIAVSAIACRVVYDLWEGVYRIERQTDQSDKTLSTKSADGVVQACLQAQNVRFADPSAFAKQRGRPVYFAAIVELNPLSQDTIQRIRRWLARPGGNQLEGNAFFGSFVSIFVSRKMGEAEKTLAFKTETLLVPGSP